VSESDRVALAERIIELAREYVLKDPYWHPPGPGMHSRSSEDIERQQRLHEQLVPLLKQWDESSPSR
jgi:hypothetical protein